MGYKLIYIDDDFEEAQILSDGLVTNPSLSINASSKSSSIYINLYPIVHQFLP